MAATLEPDPEKARQSQSQSVVGMPAGALSVSNDSSDAPRHVLIISRHHPGLYEYVRLRFASEDKVQVVLDRRRGGDRRTQRTMPAVERRSTDRRIRPGIDAALRMESMQFLTIPHTSPSDRGGSAG